MAKRKAISKRTRFEVFKRDGFRCQYCGETAPDVVLHVDHIKPVAKGGSNEIVNLVTSCAGCNSGKGAVELDDSSAVQKQRKQAEQLQERREQIEMMMLWRDGLVEIEEQEVDAVSEEWSRLTSGFYSLSEQGRPPTKRLIKKYGLMAVLEASGEAAEAYIEWNDDGSPDGSSVGIAMKKLAGFLYVRSKPQSERDLHYIRGILRRRGYVNEKSCMPMLRNAVSAGVPTEYMIEAAKVSSSWSSFWADVDEMIQEAAE